MDDYEYWESDGHRPLLTLEVVGDVVEVEMSQPYADTLTVDLDEESVDSLIAALGRMKTLLASRHGADNA